MGVIETKENMRLKSQSLLTQMAPGCEAELKGLQSRADLNGKLVVAKEFDLNVGRWIVEIQDLQESLRCKIECLKTPAERAKEEAEQRAREEAERKAKEEAERKAKEETERKVQEEAERKAKEET